MNFISDVLNSVPVVGHVKGAVHEMRGDYDNAEKAYRQCTRATAVVAGGITGGPLGAIGAGAAVDTMMFIKSPNKPQGIMRGACNIVDDVKNKRIPIMSTVETIITPACDAIGGNAAGNVFKSVTTTAGKKVLIAETEVIARQAVKVAVPVICEAALDAKNEYRNRNKQYKPTGGGSSKSGSSNKNYGSKPSSGQKSSTQNTSASSGGPPKPPRPSGTKCRTTTKTLVEQLLALLLQFFPNITPHETNRLRLLLTDIIDGGYDARVIVIALSIFKKITDNPDDVMVFASLTEFLMVYIQEQMFERMDGNLSFKQLLEIVLRNIMFSTNISQKIVSVFEAYFRTCVVTHEYGGNPSFDQLMTVINDLLMLIKAVPSHSRFRDVYSALYHYFKHRWVVAKYRGTVTQITVEQYFELIERIYKEIQYTRRYKQMKRTQNGEEPDPNLRVYDIIHESTFEMYGRRFKLVIKLQNGKIVVASCHWIDYGRK